MYGFRLANVSESAFREIVRQALSFKSRRGVSFGVARASSLHLFPTVWLIGEPKPTHARLRRNRNRCQLQLRPPQSASAWMAIGRQAESHSRSFVT